MLAAVSALIHEFNPTGVPYFDDDGDQMIGYYYQFVDKDEQPVGHLIGPYFDGKMAERAAKRAYNIRDF